MPLRLSIVIVNWNTRNVLEKCLASIYEFSPNCIYEVIVVDNASDDDSVSMIEEFFQEVIVIKNSTNLGFAQACNQGIAISKGHYVLLVNPDVQIINDAINKLLAFAESRQNAHILGCRVLGQDRKLQQSCLMFPSLLNILIWGLFLHRLFPNNKLFGRQDMTWWDANDERHVEVIKGCFFLVREELFSEIGTFDEDYFIYAEEADFCYRCKQAGYEILFTPSAEVVHFGEQSTKQKPFKMKLQLYKSYSLYFKKHHSKPKYMVASFFILIFVVLRIPIWVLSTKQERIAA